MVNFENLIIGKYYETINFDGDRWWYFKLKNIKKFEIYVENWAIHNFEYYDRFDDIVFYTYIPSDGYKFREVRITEILKYLPDDNIDKINYLRKQRINTLLNMQYV